MAPWIRIEVKRDGAFPYLWVKMPRGWNPSQCCARSIVGRFWPAIPFTKRLKGDVFEGDLGLKPNEHWAYCCGVSDRGYDANVHLVFRPSARAKSRFENEDILVEVRGLARVEIPPLPDGIADLLAGARLRCRNVWFCANQWPEAITPATEGPSLKPRQPSLFDDAE